MAYVISYPLGLLILNATLRKLILRQGVSFASVCSPCTLHSTLVIESRKHMLGEEMDECGQKEMRMLVEQRVLPERNLFKHNQN